MTTITPNPEPTENDDTASEDVSTVEVGEAPAADQQDTGEDAPAEDDSDTQDDAPADGDDAPPADAEL